MSTRLTYSARTGRKIVQPDRAISTKLESRGMMLICSAAVHGNALKELGFKMTLLNVWYWPAARLVNGRIPGEAGEYVARFGGRAGA